MAKWQETQCCGTCRHWDWAARTYRKSGRVMPDDAGDCRWSLPKIDVPIAARDGIKMYKSCTRRDDGAACPCYEMKEQG